ADDVALYLVGPACDARRRRRQDTERPARVALVLPCLATHTGDGDAQVGRAPSEQGAGQLRDRTLRSRRLAGLHRGAGALPNVAHDLRADVDVGDALPHDGVLQHTTPAGEVDERLDADASSPATTGADGDALVHQHGDCAAPSIVDVADAIGVRDAHVR